MRNDLAEAHYELNEVSKSGVYDLDSNTPLMNGDQVSNQIANLPYELSKDFEQFSSYFDWELWHKNCMMDYSSIEVLGETFYYL